MRIQSSDVLMSSNRTYEAQASLDVSYSSWGNLLANNIWADTATTLPQAMDGTDESQQGNGWDAFREEMAEDMDRMQSTYASHFLQTDIAETLSGHQKVEFQSLRNMLQLTFGTNGNAKSVKAEEIFKFLLQQQRTRLERAFGLLSGENGGISVSYSYEYKEQETTSFSSSGTVVTEDGRQIQFDVTAYMSRTLLNVTQAQMNYGQMNLIDPLVINLEGSQVQFKDENFLFDLDTDGKVDNIAILAQKCGYLALDRNEDGTINNGMELFGTQTGDGFGELAVFDMDGNGWIDENDEIFNRLRIWTKDEAGNDKLIGLGIAGIGAIYLGNASTQFQVNSIQTEQIQGVVRNSGIYLHEDGSVGTIQHIDVAMNA